MAFEINWGAFNAGNQQIAARAQQNTDRMFQALNARQERESLGRAVVALQNDPSNEEARRYIGGRNPEMLMRLQSDGREGQFRSAFADYMTAPQSTQNALAPVAQRRDIPVSATADNYQQGMTPSPMMSPRQASPMMQSAPNALAPAMPETFSPPALDPRLAARQRAIRAAPDKFLTYEGKRLDMDTERLKQLQTVNQGAMQILGGVYDDATLQAGKARARALYQQFGMSTDAIDQIPDTYSPELVRSLQMQGMDTSKQLTQIVRENRLNWDMEDDLLDNERADRNTDSMVETRQGQLANVRRGQDLTHSRGLRGQDISSRDRNRGVDVRRETTVRGQDLTDARGRRGQDITDRRGRESASFRGAGGKRGGAAAAAARIVNPATGRAAVLKNGEWVDEQTGRPLQ